MGVKKRWRKWFIQSDKGGYVAGKNFPLRDDLGVFAGGEWAMVQAAEDGVLGIFSSA